MHSFKQLFVDSLNFYFKLKTIPDSALLKVSLAYAEIVVISQICLNNILNPPKHIKKSSAEAR
jgi:hypothetical protein